MKTTDLLKAATAIACLSFALGAHAQAATDNNTVTTAPGATSATPGTSTSHRMSHAGTRSHESATGHVSDAAVTSKVKAELLAMQGLHSTHIHVKTRNGTVTLRGSVPTQEEKTMAAEKVRTIDGAHSVVNHLKVRGE